jgi:hypothetical protein
MKRLMAVGLVLSAVVAASGKAQAAIRWGGMSSRPLRALKRGRRPDCAGYDG